MPFEKNHKLWAKKIGKRPPDKEVILLMPECLSTQQRPSASRREFAACAQRKRKRI
jgi:hypothetical protein